jgi:hypothetical protein
MTNSVNAEIKKLREGAADPSDQDKARLGEMVLAALELAREVDTTVLAEVQETLAAVELESAQEKEGGAEARSRRKPKATKEAKHEEAKSLFDAFDRNSDGQVSADEMSKMLRRMGHHASEEDVRSMVDEADTDRDGQISFEEFVCMLGGGASSLEGGVKGAEDRGDEKAEVLTPGEQDAKQQQELERMCKKLAAGAKELDARVKGEEVCEEVDPTGDAAADAAADAMGGKGSEGGSGSGKGKGRMSSCDSMSKGFGRGGGKGGKRGGKGGGGKGDMTTATGVKAKGGGESDGPDGESEEAAGEGRAGEEGSSVLAGKMQALVDKMADLIRSDPSGSSQDEAGGGFGAPAFGAPAFGAPAFGAPAFGAPAFGSFGVPFGGAGAESLGW